MVPVTTRRTYKYILNYGVCHKPNRYRFHVTLHQHKPWRPQRIRYHRNRITSTSYDILSTNPHPAPSPFGNTLFYKSKQVKQGFIIWIVLCFGSRFYIYSIFSHFPNECTLSNERQRPCPLHHRPKDRNHFHMIIYSNFSWSVILLLERWVQFRRVTYPWFSRIYSADTWQHLISWHMALNLNRPRSPRFYPHRMLHIMYGL